MKIFQIMAFNTFDDGAVTFEGINPNEVTARAYKDYCEYYRTMKDNGELSPSCELKTFEEFSNAEQPIVQCLHDHVIYLKQWITLPLVQNKWFQIQLNDGNKLVAEANEVDGYREVCVYLSDFNENIFQDLAVISQQTKFVDDKGVEGVPHKYSVKVYADCDNEDFTNEYLINVAGCEI